jgi:hydrogenase expression/formation protein HypE
MSERLELSCPVPDSGAAEQILLAHGEGGRLMRRLIRTRLVERLGNKYLDALGDAAVLPACDGPLVMTTDSFVVSPLFFPGGDIGSLAVYGTVNDLAVAGARPRWISLALVIEEGLPLATLDSIVSSIAAAAQRAGVQVVTGDTKVVPRGAADRLFINTTGVGKLIEPAPAGPASLAVDDVLIASGPVGRHGMAVMAAREGFDFDPPPTSDSAPLVEAVESLRAARVPVRAMRDATRGGVAAVLHEWAEASGKTMSIDEGQLPVAPEVRGACELLGLDPIHVACEGTMVIAVPPAASADALAALRRVPVAAAATAFARVQERGFATVVVTRAAGQQIPLDEPLGAPLPRIC